MCQLFSWRPRIYLYSIVMWFPKIAIRPWMNELSKAPDSIFLLLPPFFPSMYIRFLKKITFRIKGKILWFHEWEEFKSYKSVLFLILFYIKSEICSDCFFFVLFMKRHRGTYRGNQRKAWLFEFNVAARFSASFASYALGILKFLSCILLKCIE